MILNRGFFDSRENALDWIINNQLGRRNLTEMQKSYLRGLQYQRERKKVGEHMGNQHSNWNTEPDSVFQNKGYTETAEALAEQHKVTSRTIYKDAQFAGAVRECRHIML